MNDQLFVRVLRTLAHASAIATTLLTHPRPHQFDYYKDGRVYASSESIQLMQTDVQRLLVDLLNEHKP